MSNDQVSNEASCQRETPPLGGIRRIFAAGVGFAIRGGIFDNWVGNSLHGDAIGCDRRRRLHGLLLGIISAAWSRTRCGYGCW